MATLYQGKICPHGLNIPEIPGGYDIRRAAIRLWPTPDEPRLFGIPTDHFISQTS